MTVKPQETKDVSITVQLAQAEKNRLNQEFENGTYVEGFVQLTHASHPQISIPFLAFYGDWEKPPSLIMPRNMRWVSVQVTMHTVIVLTKCPWVVIFLIVG
ncbi:Fn3-like domain-containing protein [Erysipelothrix piscisicarius]|uniref:Fn3-like domain-containing protein n=1 Tax=Erysipelothrix piscisicarius TaxID=2485784 RepID=UPI002F93120F